MIMAISNFVTCVSIQLDNGMLILGELIVSVDCSKQCTGEGATVAQRSVCDAGALYMDTM